jgi:hypothetical protein
MEYSINEGNKIGYMPTEMDGNGNLVETKLVAGAAITKGQLVMLSAPMTVTPTTGDSGAVLGIAMFDAISGKPVSVECEGLVRMTASAAITAPAKLKSAAGGKVATWVAGTDTAEEIIGTALSSATGADKIIIARLTL